MRPEMKVKVIQTDIKMHSSMISIIIQSLKEIGLQMSEHKPMLQGVFFVCLVVVFYEII